MTWNQVVNMTYMGFLRVSLIRVAPVKKVRLKQISEPCITHEILELIKVREMNFFYNLNAQIRKVLMNNFVKLEIWYKIK